jgi:hypothetical protein
MRSIVFAVEKVWKNSTKALVLASGPTLSHNLYKFLAFPRKENDFIAALLREM